MRSSLTCSVAALLVASCAPAQERLEVPPGLGGFVTVDASVVALSHVKLMDGTGRPALEGQTVVLRNGRIEAVVEASERLTPGTVGLAHGWGDPADQRPTREKGSNVQALIARDIDYDRITGLAQQSAFPVNILPLPAQAEASQA